MISQRVVCSAAHCFEMWVTLHTDGFITCTHYLILRNNTNPVQYRSSENYVVVAGITYINVKNNFTLVYLIEEIIAHANYRQTTLENDIALLFLNGIIPTDSPYIQPVSLVKQPLRDGSICLISGWGNQQKQLMAANVPILPQRLCTFIYLFLPKSQMCAGWLKGGIDACRGDSGGPLICMNSLTGIISWGIDCGRRFFPGVYTNISYFIPWIKMVNSSLNYAEFKTMRQLLLNGSCSYALNFYVLQSALLLTMLT